MWCECTYQSFLFQFADPRLQLYRLDFFRRSFLNKQSPCYAPKLAAAIEAWKAVSENPDAKSGKSVKQAITKWLRINASRFGLHKEDGSPNEQGIEEIAKISNWETKGGAPKTPTK